MKVKVTIYVEATAWEAAKNLARALAHQMGATVTASDVVREALTDYLHKHRNAKPQRKRGKSA